MLDISAKRPVSDPIALAFSRARAVNSAAGGVVVTPFDVDELPDEWVEMATGMMYRLSGFQKAQKTVDDKLAKWRADHARKSRGR